MLPTISFLRRTVAMGMRKSRMFSSADPYKTLGVERNASQDEIKKAFR